MYDNIKKFYKIYGKYAIFRMLPSVVDALRLSERRILYAAYLEAKDKLRKSIYVVGRANILHPHGDTSLYGTLAKLVSFGLLEGQGNWGSRVGLNDEPPAAARYTELKLSKQTYDLAFELISFAEYSVLDFEKEPIYLPCIVPLGLLFKDINSTPAFGIKTTIPSYKVTDLLNRLLFLLNENDNNPIIYPYYDDELIVDSDESKCEELLTTGKSTITFIPKLYIDKTNRKIEIRCRSVGKKFTSLLTYLDQKIKQGIISVIDKSTTSTNIEISVVKNKKYNFDELIKVVKQKLTSNVSYLCYFVDIENNLHQLSIDQLLINCYNYYLQCMTRYYDKQKLDLENKIKELEVIIKIRPYIKTILDDKISEDKIVSFLSEKSKVEASLIKHVISKYNIERLLYIKFDIEQLRNQLDKLRKVNITKKIISRYNQIIKNQY